ncbi:PREDICTED: uncharacterized protein LOC106122038 isoform X2 [Papilio xuthus]|uniref:Uncharacterized protein LOC106122038 isoform X2 n=1 Tax=Papilio xuthus TaxID=66420 RepID=A0AAJ6ZIZ2_PAPXU|nr:PREDICTED: uncharacterized protein LOC106122038 isoform X2 [Papilio xuthus]
MPDIISNMKKSSIYKDFYPKSSSFLSFLCDENDTCEAKTVTDDISNDDYYEDIDVKLYNEGTIVTEHPLEPSAKSYQGKLYDLKESTRKLLCLLDKILMFEPNQITEGQTINETPEKKTNRKNKLKPIQPHEGECSIYNRLSRKCQCLNSDIYNDFILLFNENVKHMTCNVGEIIKNMRILKKFLYIGDEYTKRALMFLKDGLSNSSLLEKTDIIQGCIFNDICNVFEENSIITTLITWPCKYANCGNQETMMMTATLVNKIARPEEGKRYLNLNSKIIFDIKQALKKCGNNLNAEIVEVLRAILDRLEPQFAQNLSVSYYRKTNDKGLVIQTLLNLIKHGSEMPLEEALLNLELLSNWSKQENGKEELKSYRPELLLVLKSILRVYDHSQINIYATTLLNNVVSKSMIMGNNYGITNIVVVTSTATEPIQMKSQFVQIAKKKVKKQKSTVHPGKRLYMSKQRVSDVDYSTQILDTLKKKCEKTRKQVIYVPVESKTSLIE